MEPLWNVYYYEIDLSDDFRDWMLCSCPGYGESIPHEPPPPGSVYILMFEQFDFDDSSCRYQRACVFDPYPTDNYDEFVTEIRRWMEANCIEEDTWFLVPKGVAATFSDLPFA